MLLELLLDNNLRYPNLKIAMHIEIFSKELSSGDIKNNYIKPI